MLGVLGLLVHLHQSISLVEAEGRQIAGKTPALDSPVDISKRRRLDALVLDLFVGFESLHRPNSETTYLLGSYPKGFSKGPISSFEPFGLHLKG